MSKKRTAKKKTVAHSEWKLFSVDQPNYEWKKQLYWRRVKVAESAKPPDKPVEVWDGQLLGSRYGTWATLAAFREAYAKSGESLAQDMTR